MLKIKVKASSITNLTDARYFAAREVEWLGFPLGQAGSGIDPATVKAIMEWLDGVTFVGEFELSTASEIREVGSMVGMETVQVGMFTPVVDVQQLKGLTVVKEVIVEPSASETELADHLEMYAPHVEFFLLNFSKSGISWGDVQGGSPITISFLQATCEKYKVLLEMDCAAESIGAVLEKIQPEGLSFVGGEEEAVGVKSFDDLDELLDEITVEE